MDDDELWDLHPTVDDFPEAETEAAYRARLRDAEAVPVEEPDDDLDPDDDLTGAPWPVPEEIP